MEQQMKINSFEIVHWNIQHGRSANGAKVDDPDFVRILSGSSVFCLQETKTSISLPGYKCFNKSRVKSKSGGLCTGIARDFAKRWKAREIPTDHEDILVIQLEPEASVWNIPGPLTIINVYDSPDNSSHKRRSVQDQANMMDTLLSILLSHRQSQIYLCGDFNCRTGTLNHEIIDPQEDLEIMSQTEEVKLGNLRSSKDLKPPNARGKQFIDLLASINATLLNGNCAGDVIGEMTCVKYNGSSVVDYSAVSAALFPLVKTFRILDLNVFSDHRPCSTKLRMDGPLVTESSLLSGLEEAPKRYKLNSREDKQAFADYLCSDPMRQEAMKIKGTSCSSAAETLKLNQRLVDVLKQAADNTVPIKEPPKRCRKRTIPKQPWFRHCLSSKRTVNRLSKKAIKNPSETNTAELFQAKRDYRRLCKSNKRRCIQELSRDIDNGTLDWNKIKTLKSYSPNNGNTLDAFDMRNFCNFFKDLYAKQPLATKTSFDQSDADETQLALHDILNQDISPDEVSRAIKRLKDGKAAGEDQITNEFLKASTPNIQEAIANLFNQCLSTRCYPWKTSLVTPLFKKGDRYDPNNYRAIAVASNLGKLFSSILLTRLLNFRSVNFPDPPNQLGFCKGAQTADHVLTLKTTVDKYTQGRSRLYSAFVDYSKAFDTVCREALLFKLYEYGVRGRFFGVLCDMYRGSTAKVKLLGKLSKAIDVEIGTEQGHPLSPELFKVYVHELSTQLDIATGIQSPTLAGRRITHLLWADDLVLLALDPASLQNLLKVLEDYCVTWGLTVNLKKTAIMVFNKSSVKLKESSEFVYQGKAIPSARSYCYLGVTFSLNGSFKLNESLLKQKATRAIFAIKQAIDFSTISPHTALKLFDTLVLPVASYCCQVWLPMTAWKKFNNGNALDLKAIARTPLERLHLAFCKTILGVHGRTSNGTIWGECGRLPLSLSLAGTVQRYYNRITKLEETHKESQDSQTPLIVFALQEQKELQLDWYTCLEAMRSFNWNNEFTNAWSTEIQTNRKLSFYSEMKTGFGQEAYLHLERSLAKWIARLRCSSHRFNIETGRQQRIRTSNRTEDILAKERACPLCTGKAEVFELLIQLPERENIVESEEHVMLHCPAYEKLRDQHIATEEPHLPVVLLRKLFAERPLDAAVFLRKVDSIRHPSNHPPPTHHNLTHSSC